MHINVTGYGEIKQTVLSEQQDGIAAVGNGDSGGPVFYPTGTNNSQAQVGCRRRSGCAWCWCARPAEGGNRSAAAQRCLLDRSFSL